MRTTRHTLTTTSTDTSSCHRLPDTCGQGVVNNVMTSNIQRVFRRIKA